MKSIQSNAACILSFSGSIPVGCPVSVKDNPGKLDDATYGTNSRLGKGFVAVTNVGSKFVEDGFNGSGFESQGNQNIYFDEACKGRVQSLDKED